MNRKKKKGKLWGLEKNTSPYYARQFNDQDYIDKEFLEQHPEAAEYYNQFIEEYYNNTFRSKKGLHDKAKIPRRELYAATNYRNRDIYNKMVKQGSAPLDYDDNEMDEDKVATRRPKVSLYGEGVTMSPEDSLIEWLDRERKPE